MATFRKEYRVKASSRFMRALKEAQGRGKPTACKFLTAELSDDTGGAEVVAYNVGHGRIIAYTTDTTSKESERVTHLEEGRKLQADRKAAEETAAQATAEKEAETRKKAGLSFVFGPVNENQAEAIKKVLVKNGAKSAKKYKTDKEGAFDVYAK